MAIRLSFPQLISVRVNWFVWVVVLLLSDLTNAVWQAVLGEPPAWLFWIKVGLLITLILIGLVWKPLQPVRTYFILMLALMLSLWGMNWLHGTASYAQWEHGVGWLIGMAGYQLLKLAVVLIMVIVLLLLGRRWKDFFLTPGQLGASIKPPNGKENSGKRSLSWGILGLILGVCIAPLTLLFIGIGNLPTSSALTRALPYFPVALLLAATNAFAEEMQFRASLIGELQKVIGPDQSIWLTAAFFGFAHYFGGTPAGMPGVLIAGLLGGLFAKCMLGSKGIVVPWFIHFCQNAVIYALLTIGTVA